MKFMNTQLPGLYESYLSLSKYMQNWSGNCMLSLDLVFY